MLVSTTPSGGEAMVLSAFSVFTTPSASACIRIGDAVVSPSRAESMGINVSKWSELPFNSGAGGHGVDSVIGVEA